MTDDEKAPRGEIVYAPGTYATWRRTIFLAGSIEMGAAENWQDRIGQMIIGHGFPGVVLNPRRPDWDSSWAQDPSEGTQFSEQVRWELNGILASDLVVIYFDGKTQSPITLLELGICIGKEIPMIVYCPRSFWRYGNVAFTVRHLWQNADFFDDEESFLLALAARTVYANSKRRTPTNDQHKRESPRVIEATD